MISIEGRIPISVNKAQLSKLLEGEIRKILPKVVKVGLFKITPDLSSFELSNIQIFTNQGNIKCQVEFSMPLKMKLGFINFLVKNHSKFTTELQLVEVSKGKNITDLNIIFNQIIISGLLGLFEGFLLRKANFALRELHESILVKINKAIAPWFDKPFESNFSIKGKNFENSLVANVIAARDCQSLTNTLNFDIFGSTFIQNIRPGLNTQLIDIERKEHPFEFNIAIHQLFVKEVANLFIKDLTIPIINKKIPVVLRHINIEGNIMHVGFEIDQFFKGTWQIQMDVVIQNDVLKFTLLHIESLSGESLIDKGITKALEFGVEKLLKDYAQIKISTINDLVSGQLKPVYRKEINGAMLQVNVPEFDIQHVWLDQKSILINAKWQEPFYIEL